MLRGNIRDIIKYEVNNHDKKDSVISNYMLEASFIPYFSGMLRRQVREVALDCVELISIGEVIEAMLYRELDEQVRVILTDVYKAENAGGF